MLETEVEMPEVLRPLVPSVGSVWMWEPDKAHAREPATVTAVTWNGEEVWIESESFEGKRCLNEFSRWIQAAVFLNAETPT